jgi:preprotein translocase subunit YajC
MDIFFTSAAADTAATGGFDFMGLLPLVLVFVVMYFLLIRPQQKKGQEQKKMQQNLQRGDRILTNGGIFGEVAKVLSPDEVSLEIADGVKVRVATSMIGSVLPAAGSTVRSEPAANNVVRAPAKKSASAKKPAAKKTATAKKSVGTKKTTASKKTTKAKAKTASR